MPGDKKEESLQGDIFPLSSILDKWCLVSSRLGGPLSQEEIGPTHALRATLVLLKNLYSLEDERWKAIRDNVLLGLVKDTKKYGNTSVSMGAAKRAFEALKGGKTVGFLNCGTGGIKYQRYDAEEVLHVVGEYKPKDAASPNAMQIGAYVPKVAVSFEKTSELLTRDLSSPDMPWKLSDGVPMYAFVTGLVRQTWEEANEDEKKVMEGEMVRLFQPHGILPLPGGSYFMRQDDEGALELLGAQALYVNLVKCGLLDEGTFVVGSFGIGRGSCQWMVMQKNGTPELVGHRAGMSNLPELATVSNTLMKAYSERAKFDVFLHSLQNIAKPTIALKSGAGLLLDMKEHAHLKSQLAASETYVERTVRVATTTDRNRLQSIQWKGSLDRLCAKAMLKLESKEELELVYREKDGKLDLLPRDAQVQDNEILYLGPLIVYTAPAVTTAPTVAAPAAAEATIATTATVTTATAATNTVSRDQSARGSAKPSAPRKSSCVLL